MFGVANILVYTVALVTTPMKSRRCLALYLFLRRLSISLLFVVPLGYLLWKLHAKWEKKAAEESVQSCIT